MSTPEPHLAALNMPPMSEDDYAALVDSIRQNGLLVPIELLNGRIIDGIHRQRACEEIGIEAEYVDAELDGMTPGEYVWAFNGARRHLTPSERAAAAVELLPELEQKAKARQADNARRNQPQSQKVEKIPPSEKAKTRDQAAAITGANPRYVSDLKKVKAAAPEVFERVKTGDLTVAEAKSEVAKHSDVPLRTRTNSQPGAVHARLKQGPATGDELKCIAPEYTTAVSRLRKRGVNITCEDGMYMIVEGPPPDDEMALVEELANRFSEMGPHAKHALMRRLLAEKTMAEYRQKKRKQASMRGKTASEDVAVTLDDANCLLHSVLTNRTGSKRAWVLSADAESLQGCLASARSIARHASELVGFFSKEVEHVHSR